MYVQLILSLALAACSLCPSSSAQEPIPRSVPAGPEAPAGWARSVLQSSGVIRYRPKQKEQGEDIRMQLYPRTLVGGATAEQWFRRWLGAQEPPRGKFTADPELRRASGNLFFGVRPYEKLGGAAGIVSYAAVVVDGMSVRVLEANVFPAEAEPKVSPVIVSLLQSLVESEKAAALKEGRGIAMDLGPAPIRGMTPGGTLPMGRYVGTKTWDDEARSVYEVILYPGGEFEFLQAEEDYGLVGRYVYSEATGRLDLAHELTNNRSEPEVEFCVFGIEPGGTPQIYAQSDWGVAMARYRLRFQGPVDRASPSEVRRREAYLKAELARYKHVTEPGQGVRRHEIEAVVTTYDKRFSGGPTEEAALLLIRDGRFMDAMPVPPEDLDMGLSRSREPDRWGFWKEEEGRYLFAWPVRPEEFAPIGEGYHLARPYPDKARLVGRYSTGISSTTVGGGSTFFWGIDLTKDGRFVTWRRGLSTFGSTFQSSGVTSSWDDDSSSVSVGTNDRGVDSSGTGVSGTFTSEGGDSMAHRSGTYALEGYTMVLRFDDGRIERIPSFVNGKGASSIWWRDATLRLETPSPATPRSKK